MRLNDANSREEHKRSLLILLARRFGRRPGERNYHRLVVLVESGVRVVLIAITRQSRDSLEEANF